MEKSLKNKRMSLDPAKNPFSAIQRHHNATELDVRQPPHEESQISLSNNDHNPNNDVMISLCSLELSSMPFPRRQIVLSVIVSSACYKKRAMGIIYTLLLR